MYFTVFTPTYNRAYILDRAYRTLLNQTCNDFLWVIVDDGSEDNTEEMVQEWISEERIAIKYIKQENKGRFGAYNTGTQYFTGELLVFLDSDDALKPNALEELKKIWEGRNKKLNPPIIGMIFYMEYPDGKIIGNKLPDIYSEKVYVLRDKYGVKGDKAQVYDRKIFQRYKYPIFPGEKFIGDSLIMNRANEHGQMMVVQKSLYIREYLSDSITNNILRVGYASPKGMALYYKETIKYYKYNRIKRAVYAMKYVAFSRIGKTKIFDKKVTNKFCISMMYLPGIFYSIWIQSRAKK